MSRSFAVRGVVEGFYGTPWNHDARLEVIEFLARRGMNAYAYAPKDDTRQRTEWRTPYPAAELTALTELAGHAAAHGVRFGFAISPGLDIAYESATDRAALLSKLVPMRAAGVGWFLLLFDDIPMQRALAPRQADLAAWLLEELGDAALTVCPTEYVGTHPSPYLTELGVNLPAAIDVMWTGPTVCSEVIHEEHALGWAKALGERHVILWDNYPVNDALMTHALHLGPYTGRDAALADRLGGVLCNPMIQPRASQVALATAMDFLRTPDDYEPDCAWKRAIADVGADRAEPLAVLARACADSPIATPDRLESARATRRLAEALDGPDWPGVVSDFQSELRAARALPDALPPDEPLGGEVAPWVSAARRAAEAGLGALRLVQHARPIGQIGEDGRGRVVVTDPEAAMHAAFLVLFVWQAARSDDQVVFGPRFALYTPIIQLPDGAPALDARAAVREDANAIDALCRLALATYDSWRTLAAGQALRALVDGEERLVAPDGSFDARGADVIVGQGPHLTRVGPLPFRDQRLP